MNQEDKSILSSLNVKGSKVQSASLSFLIVLLHVWMSVYVQLSSLSLSLSLSLSFSLFSLIGPPVVISSVEASDSTWHLQQAKREEEEGGGGGE